MSIGILVSRSMAQEKEYNKLQDFYRVQLGQIRIFVMRHFAVLEIYLVDFLDTLESANLTFESGLSSNGEFASRDTQHSVRSDGWFGHVEIKGHCQLDLFRPIRSRKIERGSGQCLR